MSQTHTAIAVESLVDSSRSCSFTEQSIEASQFEATSFSTRKPLSPETHYKRNLAKLTTGADIYIDSCTLMNDTIEQFFNTFAKDLMNNGVKFLLLPQIRQEVENLSRVGDDEQKQKSSRALAVLKKYNRLFRYAPSDIEIYDGDCALCREMFRNHAERNQILLTQDYKLAVSILNFCGSLKAPGANVETTVYRLTKYAAPGLFNLEIADIAPSVTLPASYQRAFSLPACRSSYQAGAYVPYQFAPSPSLLAASIPPDCSLENYLSESLENGSAIITCAALRDVFDACGNNTFLARLHQLYLNGNPVRLQVIATGLTDDLRLKMAPWMHLFEIIQPEGTFYSETDALIAALYTEPWSDDRRYNLLICHDPHLYDVISSRRPACYSTRQLWGSLITLDGYFCSARRALRYLNLTNYSASSSLCA